MLVYITDVCYADSEQQTFLLLLVVIIGEVCCCLLLPTVPRFQLLQRMKIISMWRVFCWLLKQLLKFQHTSSLCGSIKISIIFNWNGENEVDRRCFLRLVSMRFVATTSMASELYDSWMVAFRFKLISSKGCLFMRLDLINATNL